MIKKNDIVDLEIIDNGSAFEGIAKLDGIVIFVPGAIITEKVRAKIIKVTASYAIARIEEFLGIKVHHLEDPAHSVVKGAAVALKKSELLKNVDYQMRSIKELEIE